MATKTADDGNIVLGVYRDLEDNEDQTMDDLMDMLLDMTDGDHDNTRAIGIGLKLYKKSAAKKGIFTRLKLKLYREAEAAVMRMMAQEVVANGK